MAVWVDFIFLSLFYDHPFVTEESGNFNRFVMSQLNILQGISFLQPFQIIVITGNTDVCKSCFQQLPDARSRKFPCTDQTVLSQVFQFSFPGGR